LTYFVYFHFRNSDGGGEYWHICLPSVAKAKSERDPNAVGQFQCVDYDLYLHYAIGHLHRADGALPDFAKDFLLFAWKRRAQVHIAHILHIMYIMHIDLLYFVSGISSVRSSLFMGFGTIS
jgi:hypothetical protein